METRHLVNEFSVMLDTAHRIRVLLNQRTHKLTGLSLQQVTVMCRIELGDGMATVSSLAEANLRTNHTVTAMVNGLEREGLVFRQRNTGGDRRRIFVHLSPKGHAKVGAFRAMAIHLLASFLGEITQDELLASLTHLREVLGRLIPVVNGNGPE